MNHYTGRIESPGGRTGRLYVEPPATAEDHEKMRALLLEEWKTTGMVLPAVVGPNDEIPEYEIYDEIESSYPNVPRVGETVLATLNSAHQANLVENQQNTKVG